MKKLLVIKIKDEEIYNKRFSLEAGNELWNWEVKTDNTRNVDTVEFNVGEIKKAIEGLTDEQTFLEIATYKYLDDEDCLCGSPKVLLKLHINEDA